jgi:hypothetical protein
MGCGVEAPLSFSFERFLRTSAARCCGISAFRVSSLLRPLPLPLLSALASVFALLLT